MYRIHTSITPPLADPIQSLDVSPDGRWIAVGQALDQTHSLLTVWDAATLRLAQSIDLNGWLMRVRFLSHEQMVITTAGPEAAISIYDIHGRKKAERSTGTTAFPWLHTAPQAQRLVVSGRSLWVLNADLTSLWTYDADSETQTPRGVLSTYGEYVATTETVSQKIEVVALDTGAQVGTIEGAFAQTHWLEADSAEHYLLAIERYTKGVFIWDLTTHQRHLPHIINEDMRSFWCAHFHPSEEMCVMGNLIGFVSVLRLSDGEFVLDQKAHESRVWEVRFSPNGERLFTASEDGVVHVWHKEDA